MKGEKNTKCSKVRVGFYGEGYLEDGDDDDDDDRHGDRKVLHFDTLPR